MLPDLYPQAQAAAWDAARPVVARPAPLAADRARVRRDWLAAAGLLLVLAGAAWLHLRPVAAPARPAAPANTELVGMPHGTGPALPAYWE